MQTQPQTTHAAPSAANVDARAKAAREAMGTKWIGHPNASHNPRHSAWPADYEPARETFLAGIRAAAAADRAANPKAIQPKSPIQQ